MAVVTKVGRCYNIMQCCEFFSYPSRSLFRPAVGLLSALFTPRFLPLSPPHVKHYLPGLTSTLRQSDQFHNTSLPLSWDPTRQTRTWPVWTPPWCSRDTHMRDEQMLRLDVAAHLVFLQGRLSLLLPLEFLISRQILGFLRLLQLREALVQMKLPVLALVWHQSMVTVKEKKVI